MKQQARAWRRCAARLGCCLIALAAAPAPAAEGEFRQVSGIFERHCAECHDAASAELELDLTSREALLRGSETGAVVVPGRAAESLLVQVLAKGAKPHMPPDGQLAQDEIAAIAAWIDSLDAATPVGRPRIRPEDREHWAFQPVRQVEPPEPANPGWCRTPIDRFILAELQRHGLKPAPEAEPEKLVRRVYLNLIGLPPSPEELDEVVEGDFAAAYPELVDRLLASPHYGERWGRHWLDLARYADSSGFHEDLDRPDAWRYRDYVIASFNADKPYSQFIREQLAGDEMPHAEAEAWIATGFARHGPSNDDNAGSGPALERYRLDLLDDVIATTGNVFLGLTIGCARCHDHKYDPLTQADYYSLLAFFDSAERLNLRLEDFNPAEPELIPLKKGKEKNPPPAAMVFSDRGRKARSTHILWRGDPFNRGPQVECAPPAILAERLPLTRVTEAETLSAESPRGRRTALAEWLAHPENPLTYRVLANRIWMHHFGRGLVATPSNFGRQGEPPSHPELLDWLADELRSGRQSIKSLHRMIVTSAVYRQASSADPEALRVDPENRLLARMPLRRLEAEVLRDSMLVASGKLNRAMGGPGVKPRIRPELLTASQRNKWPVVKQEGPEHWRRSVYVYIKRQLQFPMLELFDAPPTSHSCARREESLVPTQALVLLNDEFAHEQARCFAERVRGEVGEGEVESRVARALRIALGDAPSRERIASGKAFLLRQAELLEREGLSPAEAEQGALADFCQVLFNLSEFLYVD